MPIHPPTQSVTLRIKPKALLAEAARCGLVGTPDIAGHIGVNSATVWRALKGAHAPSPEFIAATLTGFPECKFGDLFEVVAS